MSVPAVIGRAQSVGHRRLRAPRAVHAAAKHRHRRHHRRHHQEDQQAQNLMHQRRHQYVLQMQILIAKITIRVIPSIRNPKVKGGKTRIIVPGVLELVHEHRQNQKIRHRKKQAHKIILIQ